MIKGMIGGGVGVPISTFKSYLEPQLLAALQKVFDEAWQEINLLPGRAATARDAAERRTDLAQMIFLAHKSGIPPERIKDAVLGRQIPGPPKPASRRNPL
jgi:hypothetical protein